MTLLQQFEQNWRAGKNVKPGSVFLLAVSGGIDSMVMAHLFLESGIPFAVAHCNFMLRGAESDLDEALVHDWCATNNIPFHDAHFETKKFTEEWKTGTQETARILRYEWFEQVRKEKGYSKIVTAHHANDNVETLLINLFKGTGIGGLHGILPDSNNILRPLLFATKEMISAYAYENDVRYRDDASNVTDDYLRNSIRNNIIPAVQHLFPNAVASVNESISRFAQAEVLYRRAIESERKKLVEKRGPDHYIPIRKLSHRDPLPTILFELILPFGFHATQLTHVLGLLSSETGHYVSSQTHRIIRNRDFLIITTLPTHTAGLIVIEGAPCVVEAGKYHFSFSIHDKPKQIDTDPNTACLDIGKVEFPMILRKWKTGDYLYPLGMKMKKKKVSKLLIEVKMPLHEKEHVWILESGKRIAWVAGLRPDERFKLTDATEKVLTVKRTEEA